MLLKTPNQYFDLFFFNKFITWVIIIFLFEFCNEVLTLYFGSFSHINFLIFGMKSKWQTWWNQFILKSSNNQQLKKINNIGINDEKRTKQWILKIWLAKFASRSSVQNMTQMKTVSRVSSHRQNQIYCVWEWKPCSIKTVEHKKRLTKYFIQTNLIDILKMRKLV